MQAIEELLMNIARGDIVYMRGTLPSQRQEHFLGYYWGVDESPAKGRFFGERAAGAQVFSMHNPSGEDPAGEDYGLEHTLPQLRVSQQRICSCTLREGTIIPASSFREVSLDELVSPYEARTVRIELEGVDNAVVGFIYEKTSRDEYLVTPSTAPFVAPPLLESVSGGAAEEILLVVPEVEERGHFRPPIVREVYRLPVKRVEVFSSEV